MGVPLTAAAAGLSLLAAVERVLRRRRRDAYPRDEAIANEAAHGIRQLECWLAARNRRADPPSAG